MIVEVRDSAFSGKDYISKEATRVIIRDKEGYLVSFVAIMKDRETMVLCVKGQDDFEWNAQNHKIPLHIAPGDLEEAQRLTNQSIVLG